ncbi:hypothetical protein NQZ70_10672 [Sorangium sp. Soce836]|nr:hypothetical protein NQZ70_10672 [Sorangium sp. Soce836]
MHRQDEGCGCGAEANESSAQQWITCEVEHRPRLLADETFEERRLVDPLRRIEHRQFDAPISAYFLKGTFPLREGYEQHRMPRDDNVHRSAECAHVQGPVDPV